MINKLIYLLFNLIDLILYKNKISKLEKERENTKYILIDGENKGQDFYAWLFLFYMVKLINYK